MTFRGYRLRPTTKGNPRKYGEIIYPKPGMTERALLAFIRESYQGKLTPLYDRR